MKFRKLRKVREFRMTRFLKGSSNQLITAEVPKNSGTFSKFANTKRRFLFPFLDETNQLQERYYLLLECQHCNTAISAIFTGRKQWNSESLSYQISSPRKSRRLADVFSSDNQIISIISSTNIAVCTKNEFRSALGLSSVRAFAQINGLSISTCTC